jgi:hypothetical protein
MSETHIPVALGRFVAARAKWHCEYFRIAEEDTWFGCQVDHIVSEKHGGPTDADNLAFACAPCNRHKGSDVATVDQTGTLVALFHPRKHPWQEHFKLADALIVCISAIGTATVRILKMNLPYRIEERRWSKPFREGTV